MQGANKTCSLIASLPLLFPRATVHVLPQAFAFGKSSIPLVTCEGGDFGFTGTIAATRREHIVSGHRLSEDLRWILNSQFWRRCRAFYQKLMRDSLGRAMLRDSLGLDDHSLRQTEGELPETLANVSLAAPVGYGDYAGDGAACLRRKPTLKWRSAVAIFCPAPRTQRVNRDKTDLIATFLYRHPRVHGREWEQGGYGLDGALPLSPFEIALIEILADTDVPSLAEEHVQ